MRVDTLLGDLYSNIVPAGGEGVASKRHVVVLHSLEALVVEVAGACHRGQAFAQRVVAEAAHSPVLPSGFQEPDKDLVPPYLQMLQGSLA